MKRLLQPAALQKEKVIFFKFRLRFTKSVNYF